MTVADKREVYYCRKGIDCYFMTLGVDSSASTAHHGEGHHEKMAIDATDTGNITRFLKYSCASNCATDEMIHRYLPFVAIFAAKDIPRNAELTYDYDMSHDSPESLVACNFGSRRCRRFL